MSPFDGLWAALFFVLLFSFPLMVVFGRLIYRKTENKAYSFLNCFPYEFYASDPKVKKGAYLAFLIIYAAASLAPLGEILPHTHSYGNLLVFAVLIAILSVIAALTFLALSVLPARFTRPHIIVSTIYLAVVTILAGAVAVYGFVIAIDFGPALEPVHLALAVLSTILMTAMMVAMFNPKLKNWARLETVSDAKGEITFRRPRFFPLAYTEWIAALIHYLSLVILMLTFLAY